ncbi:MAG: AAA family ATPase, partial [Bacteroidetes bacterium QS_1_65_9]
MAPSPSPSEDPNTLDDLSAAYDRLRNEIGKVIVGQEDIIEMVVVCLMAQGHTLL